MKLFLCILFSFQAFFLPSQVFSANNNDSLNKQDSSIKHRNFGLGLDFNLSTIGPGGTVAFKFHKHWSVREGFNYFNYNSEFDGKYFGYNLHHKPNLKLGATTINLDFFPSQHSSFFLSAGIAYVFNHYNYGIAYNDSITQGEITIKPDQIGTITIDIKTHRIMPYLGMGFGRAVPKKRIGTGIEIGCFYQGQPKVLVQATGLIQKTDTQSKTIEENIKNYSFFPLIKFKISIKLF
jgi:hypothetical protein